MRGTLDRLRHTLLFEVFAVLIAVPLVRAATGHSTAAVAGLTLALSILAMAWNYLYNWGFDHWERRRGLPRQRTLGLRIVHALGFEAVLLLVGVMAIAWALDMSLVQALMLDIGFALFFLFYAFAFNWVYDLFFPAPQTPAST